VDQKRLEIPGRNKIAIELKLERLQRRCGADWAINLAG
jgi:hypothetical protein